MPRWSFGKLANGGIRICECGEITLEDEMHVCSLGDEMTGNPINELEDEKFWFDTGKQAYLIYTGAMEAGADGLEAAIIIAAYYQGMTQGVLSNNNEKENEDEETPSSEV